MKICAYCGFSNLDTATDCTKCGTSLQPLPVVQVKSFRFGPEKAKELRNKALGYFVLGLIIKVYWGGYGSWPVYDNDLLMSFRSWVQPALIYGGVATYVVGWILKWV